MKSGLKSLNDPVVQTQAYFPDVLTLQEVADFLRCSKAHVCKAVLGKVAGVTPLPAISMGRRKLVRRKSLESWLADNDPGPVGAILERSHNGTP